MNLQDKIRAVISALQKDGWTVDHICIRSEQVTGGLSNDTLGDDLKSLLLSTVQEPPQEYKTSHFDPLLFDGYPLFMGYEFYVSTVSPHEAKWMTEDEIKFQQDSALKSKVAGEQK